MKKKYLGLILIFTLVLGLVGCGKSESTEVNMEELSDRLLSEVDFEDELSQIDQGTIANLYGLDQIKEGKVYISSGATAEEIAILEFDSKEEAKKGKEALEKRVEEQIAVYESYDPEEVKRLENASIKQIGNYSILVVAKGDQAEKIINK